VIRGRNKNEDVKKRKKSLFKGGELI